MPDGVKEYRCPSCNFQLPLLVPGQIDGLGCPEWETFTGPHRVIRGVDTTGLVNLVACSRCGGILGRYWGLM